MLLSTTLRILLIVLTLAPLCFAGVLSGNLLAQTVIHFQPVLDGAPLILAEENGEDLGAVPSSGTASSGPGTYLEEGAAAGAVQRDLRLSRDEKKVEVLRWYLTDLVLLRDGKTVFTPKKRHHLLDAEKPESLNLQLNTEPGLTYDELRFTLGVDSLTAASGVFGEDLDPTNGMYWTWRSGYINFKLEGTAPECPARKNRFQFHVGGFQGPFASQRQVRLAVSPVEVISIDVNLDRFFEAVNLKIQYQVMSPNTGSAELADTLATIFLVR